MYNPMMMYGRRGMKYGALGMRAQENALEESRLRSPTAAADFMHSFDPNYDPDAAARAHEHDLQDNHQRGEQWRIGEENQNSLARIRAQEGAQTERTKLSEAGMGERARAALEGENWRTMYNRTTPQASNEKYGALALKNYDANGTVTGETPFLYNQQTGDQAAWQKGNNGAPAFDLSRYNFKDPAHIQELVGHYSQMNPEQQSQFGQTIRSYPDLHIAFAKELENQQKSSATPGEPGGLARISTGTTAPSLRSYTGEGVPIESPGSSLETGAPVNAGLNRITLNSRGNPAGPVFFQPQTLNSLNRWGANMGLIPSENAITGLVKNPVPTPGGEYNTVTGSLRTAGKAENSFEGPTSSLRNAGGNPGSSDVMGTLRSFERPDPNRQIGNLGHQAVINPAGVNTISSPISY
jgi:hypothetical protein